MKKHSLLPLVAVALIACNRERSSAVQQPVLDSQTPVVFGAYVNRPTTKAGLNDATLETEDLQGAGVGFGVFAYYTNADSYDQSYTPNFMYNQQVKYINSTTGWQYSPVKYWPNEFGSGAASDDADQISLFAYAPYVSVNPSSGKVVDRSSGEGRTYAQDNGDATKSIVGMKRNNATGDPMVQYIVSAYTDRQVDLVWGTAANLGESGWPLKNGGKQTPSAGLPYLDIRHPSGTSTSWSSAQKVSFDFRHALAKLSVTVDTRTNGTSAASPAADTKVFVRSVTFEGFGTQGALNLNNTKPGEALWYNFDCGNELDNGSEFTIFDGRKDGKEGLTAAGGEYAAINPTLVQDGAFAFVGTGVTGTAANLFRTEAGATPAGALDPILVIPNGDKLKVTIEYDVLTRDTNLAETLNDGITPGSVVKNVITRYITANGGGSVSSGDITLANGKQYTISLHLGLNSVEFDASVSNWDTSAGGGADLPGNSSEGGGGSGTPPNPGNELYGVHNGHAYVDLGLRDGSGNRILFATMNVGASSETDYGDFFAWGETSKRYSSLTPGDPGYVNGATFELSNCPFHTGSNVNTGWSKYIPAGEDSYGTPDNKLTLDPSDDVAHVRWSGEWRMPDADELLLLLNRDAHFNAMNPAVVSYEWVEDYHGTGKNGLLVTGKNTSVGDFSSASLFLPAAGICYSNLWDVAGGNGSYWSRSLMITMTAWKMHFVNSEQGLSGSNRDVGHSVRPVLVLPE